MENTNILKSIIKNGLRNMYRNLNGVDFDFLQNLLEKLIKILFYQYNFNTNPDIFYNQLIQNDYKDIKWLSTLLLPFMNSDPSELKSFDELYSMKKNPLDSFKDINTYEPEYKFTNLQYGRCLRFEENNEIKCKEIKFDYDHLNINFKLLIQTLILCSNKMYVNWLNIIPIPVDTIPSNITYQNTIYQIETKQMKEFDIVKYCDNEKIDVSENDKMLLGSLYIGDIYNCLRNYIYEEIKEIKILIFDVVILPLKDKIISIHALNEIFSHNKVFVLESALANIDWVDLEENHKKIFINSWDKILNSYFNNIEIKIKYEIDNTENTDNTDNIDNIDNIENIDKIINKNYIISKISLQRLVKGININFDRRFSNKKKTIESGYITIKNDDDIDEDNIDEYNF
jgi:hypothetical protein